MFFVSCLKLLVFVSGIVWCVAILRRLPSDLRDFRESSEGPTRAILGLFWAFTGLVLLWVIPFGWSFLSGLARLVR